MAAKHLSPETLLPRRQFAEALTEAGYPIAPATLATMAVRGGGPAAEYWGRIPLYRWGPGLKWAQDRLSKPVRTTAEAAAQKRARSVKPQYPAEAREAAVAQLMCPPGPLPQSAPLPPNQGHGRLSGANRARRHSREKRS